MFYYSSNVKEIESNFKRFLFRNYFNSDVLSNTPRNTLSTSVCLFFLFFVHFPSILMCWKCINASIYYQYKTIDLCETILFNSYMFINFVCILIFFSKCSFSPENMGLLDPATSDGRVIFFLPWQKMTIAGNFFFLLF